MGIIDEGYLIHALRDAAEEGVRAALTEVKDRAQTHAPVRDIFKHPGVVKGKNAFVAQHRWTPSGVETLKRSLSAPETMSVRSAQRLGFFTVGTLPTKTGHVVSMWAGSNQGFLVSKRSSKNLGIPSQIRGRANSFAPVIKSPAGYIGGEDLRRWGGNNRLAIGQIRYPGGRFNLASLLSARGRYEAFGAVGPGGKRSGKGRAVRTSDGGQQMVGGTLRDGITVDGPHVWGSSEVYGFVQAVAHDPGRTHNYAKDQEFGSRHNRAQPFLRRALRESKEKIVKMVDPTKAQRGILQRAFQTGARPSSRPGEGIGIPINIKAEASGQWSRLSADLARHIGAEV